MPIRDLLLQLSSYPQPTPRWALDAAASVADLFDARLSAALCHVHIPRISNYLADKLVHANEAIAAENAKSDRNAKALLSDFALALPPERMGDEIARPHISSRLLASAGTARRARTHPQMSHDAPSMTGNSTRVAGRIPRRGATSKMRTVPTPLPTRKTSSK